MGLINTESDGAVNMHPDTLDMKDIKELLLELIGVYKKEIKDFRFSTIMVMRNLTGDFHNPRFVAPSVAISIGDFFGGDMRTKDEDHGCTQKYNTHNIMTTINMTWRHNIDT